MLTTSPPAVDSDPQVVLFRETLQHTIRTLERRHEERRKLYEAASRANHGVTLDDILERVYREFRPLIPCDRIGLALLEDQGKVLRSRWVWVESGQPMLKPGYHAPMRGTSLPAVLESGRPRIINDLPAYLARRPDSQATRLMVEGGFRSNLACPLVALGKPVGFLFFSSRETGTYRESHAGRFEQLAPEVSVIIQKGRIYEELQRANGRLEEEVRQLALTEAELRRTQAALEEANRSLRRLAATDGLTGVANRRAFDAGLDREWRRASRTGSPLALVLIDIDQFKAFNDSRGHLAGDDCLREVASALRRGARRPYDLVARYGGEEFAVLLPETGRAPALRVAERLRQSIESLGVPRGPGPAGAVVTASLGVAAARPAAGDDPSELVRAADLALYQAKQGGRNRVSSPPENGGA